MTSASELFYSRRHRFGRNNPLDSSPLPDLHHRHRRRHHHQDHHHVRRPSSSTERGSDRLDWRHSRSMLNDGDDDEEHSGNVLRGMRARPPRVRTADRSLPAGVLLARARLVERLRGHPLSFNYRQNYRDSMGRDQESELSSDVLDGASLVTELTSQMERSQLLQELNTKPPGLTQEALDCLHVEFFRGRDSGLESRLPQDCGICLETFMDGDKLICLPCGHKFHSACLDPWVRCCGDCPYCRRGIVLHCNLREKETE